MKHRIQIGFGLAAMLAAAVGIFLASGAVAQLPVLPLTPVPVATAQGDQVNPSVAFNTQRDEFMVVWADARNGARWDIYGQRLTADADLVGDNFLIATTAITVTIAAPFPRIAWNTANNEFLVAWKSIDNEGVIYGQRLNQEGASLGPRRTLSPIGIDREYFHQRIGLAYNPDDNEYLLAWTYERLNVSAKVEVQRLSYDGARIGSESAACPACTGQSQRNPVVVYNPTADEYFLAWQESFTGNVEIIGQRLSRTAGQMGTKIDIVTETGTQNLPDVAYNPITNQYAVIWRDGRTSGVRQVWGRTYGADGVARTNPMTMTTLLTDQRNPAVEWHSGDSLGYLVLWSENTRVYTGTNIADLMARWLDGNGMPFGADLLAVQGYGADNPDLAYSQKWVRYLLVWQDGRNDADGPENGWRYDIYAGRHFTGPTPTPTSTKTPTPTPTPTRTATPTLTAMPTATATRPAGAAHVEGIAYHDLNDDGMRDAGEPPLAGALVEAYVYPANVWVAAFTTQSDGRYFFNLAVGTYRIEQMRAPAGYVRGSHYAPLIQTLQPEDRITHNFPNILPTPTATRTPTNTPTTPPSPTLSPSPTATETPTPTATPVIQRRLYVPLVLK